MDKAINQQVRLEVLADELRNGEIDLLGHLDTLARRFEATEPTVRAFLPEKDRFDRLRRQAQALLERYPKPQDRPPLFGVPIGIKDVFHVEGFRTAAGAGEPTDVIQGAEADVVERLKLAGALILGKTVTTEFAYFAPGPTRNPHNPEHTPGGSSSGSAAAVAAGLSGLTLGTQTIGSVIRPAAFCGVVGFKPSYGRVSRAGLIPLARSVDHVGFFTASAAGAQLAAEHLCYDWAEPRADGRPVLGVPRGTYLEHAEPVGQTHYRRICEYLADEGFELREFDAFPDFETVREAHDRIVAAEAAQAHSKWYREYEERYHPKTRELLDRGHQITDDQLARARDRRLRLRHRLTRAMDESGIDLWLAPAAPGPAPKGIDSTGDPVMNLPWTHSGLPVLGLPAGESAGGLPLAVQVAGRWYGDEDVLAWGLQLEDALEGLRGHTVSS
ncbi:MAG: amidase [Anaerolineales bacterium]|nr:amidase [Anaerolineales bacterium]